MEAAVEKRWSVTVSYLQAWTYTGLPDARYALETLSFFPAYYALFGGATCSVSV